jgi:hypothetical protein
MSCDIPSRILFLFDGSDRNQNLGGEESIEPVRVIVVFSFLVTTAMHYDQ